MSASERGVEELLPLNLDYTVTSKKLIALVQL